MLTTIKTIIPHKTIEIEMPHRQPFANEPFSILITDLIIACTYYIRDQFKILSFGVVEYVFFLPNCRYSDAAMFVIKKDRLIHLLYYQSTILENSERLF